MDTLHNIIKNIEEYYTSREIVKTDKTTNQPILKNGEVQKRQINSTKEPLKQIQKRIYKFFKQVKVPPYAFGGVPQKDNILNAKKHQGNKYIFTTDLKSFFPSISNKNVYNLFVDLGCTPEISRILTQLTTFKYQLPQGVPTSTLLANQIFKKTGDKLCQFSVDKNLTFTSFVDDLTFSSKSDFKEYIPNIISIITDDGYKISHSKTKYKTKNPIITGVVCQNNRLKLNNDFYKRYSKLRLSTDAKIERVNGLKNYIKRFRNQ